MRRGVQGARTEKQVLPSNPTFNWRQRSQRTENWGLVTSLWRSGQTFPSIVRRSGREGDILGGIYGQEGRRERARDQGRASANILEKLHHSRSIREWLESLIKIVRASFKNGLGLKLGSGDERERQKSQFCTICTLPTLHTSCTLPATKSQITCWPSALTSKCTKALIETLLWSRV